MRSRFSSLALSSLVFVVLLGCGSSDGTSTQSIAMTLSNTSLSLGQGSETSVTVDITRTNFDKPVTLAVQGSLPNGVTATFAQNPLPAGTSSTQLTIDIAPNVVPASATFTVRATGEGVTEQSQVVTLTISLTGGYTLGLLAPSVAVAQGAAAQATVLLTRLGGNAGDVTLSATGLPASVGATFAQSPTSGGGVSVTLAAGAGAAVGAYPITITSSQPGVQQDQSVNLSLQIIAPPATAQVTVPFCPASIPSWFGFLNEGNSWQQVTPVGANFTFNATERVGLAYAHVSGQSARVTVYYVTRAEIQAFVTLNCAGARTYSGSVSGLSTGQAALVVMASSLDVADATTPSFALQEVPERPLDLFAARGVIINNSFFTPDRLVVRRGLDLPSGTALPDVSFTAPESFAPASTNLTINGNDGGQVIFQNLLWTTTGTFGLLQIANPQGTTATLYSVPTDRVVSTDLHEFFVQTTQSLGSLGRAYIDYARDPVADKAVSFGPVLSTPVASSIGSAPYARLRGTLASQPEYGSIVRFIFGQGSLSSTKEVWVVVTSTYLGGTPTTWDVAIPDFSGAAGFNTSWMLAPNQSGGFSADAFSGRIALLLGAPPVDGDVYRVAFREAGISTLRNLRAQPGRMMPPTAAPQYLRR